MRFVTAAEYVSGFKLKVRFDDKTEKIVDLGPHLDGPIFRPLKDPAYFRSFSVNQDLDTITWPNHADFAPEFLYRIGRPGPKNKRKA